MWNSAKTRLWGHTLVGQSYFRSIQCHLEPPFLAPLASSRYPSQGWASRCSTEGASLQSKYMSRRSTYPVWTCSCRPASSDRWRATPDWQKTLRLRRRGTRCGTLPECPGVHSEGFNSNQIISTVPVKQREQNDTPRAFWETSTEEF